MQITKDMTVGEIISINPYISNILMGVGMHCISCVAASGETLAEAGAVHGFSDSDVDVIVSNINEFLASQEGAATETATA